MLGCSFRQFFSAAVSLWVQDWPVLVVQWSAHLTMEVVVAGSALSL